MAYTATDVVSANSSGGLTVGNGFVQGFFGANTLLCTNLAGGSLAGYTPLTITTNVVIFDGLLTVGDPTTNTTVNSTSIITANIYTAALTVGNAITNAVIGAAGLSYGTADPERQGRLHRSERLREHDDHRRGNRWLEYFHKFHRSFHVECYHG